MATGVAIRHITTNPDGRIDVGYSLGHPTAPAAQDGSFIWQNDATLKEEIALLESTLTKQQFVLLHLAMTWLQPNGTFGNISQVLNKEVRFDTAAAQPLKVV